MVQVLAHESGALLFWVSKGTHAPLQELALPVFISPTSEMRIKHRASVPALMCGALGQ